MKFKKILAAAGGVLLLSALCAASSYAEETTGGTAGEATPAPAESTTPEPLTPEAALRAAILNATDGDTITLTQEVKGIREPIEITKNLTIDLNGCELSGTVSGSFTGLIKVKEGINFTLKDSATRTKGVLLNTTEEALAMNAIYVVGDSTITSGSNINIEGAKVEVSALNTDKQSSYGVSNSTGGTFTADNATIIVNSGHIAQAVYTSNQAKVEIKNHSTIQSKSYKNYAKGLSLPYSTGGITISDSSIKVDGYTGAHTYAVDCGSGSLDLVLTNVTIEARSNNTNAKAINISNSGVKTLTLKNIDVTVNAPNGDAYIVANGKSGVLPVITEGTYKVNEGTPTMQNVLVSGGSFNFPVPDNKCDINYIGTEQKDENGYYHVRRMTKADAVVVVTKGDQELYYASLSRAINDQNSGSSNKTSDCTITVQQKPTKWAIDTGDARFVVNKGATVECSKFVVKNGENSGEIIVSGDTLSSSNIASLTKFTNTSTGTITSANTININADVTNDGTIKGSADKVAMNVLAPMNGSKTWEPNAYKWSTADNDGIIGGKVDVIRNGAVVKGYSDLRTALANCQKDDTLRLMANGKASVLEVKENVTIDLNGYTLTGNNLNQYKVTKGDALTVTNGATLTVKDSSPAGEGKITVAGSGEVIVVHENSTFILEGGTIANKARAGTKGAGAIRAGSDGSLKSPNAQIIIKGGNVTSTTYGISLFGVNDASKAPKLTVEGGTISSTYSAIIGNGTVDYGQTEIKVSGGKISSTGSCAIYHPQDGKMEVTGGTITGLTGIEVRAGELNIEGGTITSSAKELTKNDTPGDGPTITGAAVAVSQHGTNCNTNVNIKGGTLNGVKAIYEEDLLDDKRDNITITVSNVNATGDVESQNCTGFITGGTFTTDVQKYVASGSAEKKGDSNSFEVVQAGAASSEGTYVTGVENNKYSQLEIVDKTISQGYDPENIVTFNVHKNDGTPDTTIKGKITGTEIAAGTVRFGLIVTGIPTGETVTITPATTTVE